jgi:phytoene synthase
VTAAVDPARLERAYAHCRRLNARHGKTFYLATGLLPKPARKHVHALYGFARYADDLVDSPRPGPTGSPAIRLAALAQELQAGLDGAPAANPVVLAVCATVAEFDLDRSLLTDFLASMTSDLTVTRYPSFADLQAYMWGSASVIGLQLLPVLGVVGDPAEAARCAADLGVAFQLTNFLRDVGEDYRRGRIYLPQQSLAARGVQEWMFTAPATAPELKDAIADEIARARSYYRQAAPGVDLLHPASRDCVRTASTLYGEILDEIERSGHEVLARRAVVPRRRRLRVGLSGYRRAVLARRAPSS